MKNALVILIAVHIASSLALSSEYISAGELIHVGNRTESELDSMLQQASAISDIGERTDFLSRQFLNVKYKESTLIGSLDTNEVFVINLEAVDCMAFLEYIEAMRRSASYAEFKHNLKRIRYRDGKVDYRSRNHYFTDWKENNSRYVKDLTQEIGGNRTKAVIKRLNYITLPDIPVKGKEICFIPSGSIDSSVLNSLNTGDYTGIYSPLSGLDVSHAGIVIKKKERIRLRHASSLHGKVTDSEFKGYVLKTQGIIVFRPVE